MIEVVDDVGSAEAALEILRGSPSRSQVEECLRYLRASPEAVALPGPVSAQLITSLVSKTLPDFYPLDDSDALSTTDAQFRTALIEPLETVSGLGALVARIRSLLKDRKELGPRSGTHETQVLFDVLHRILNGTDCSERVYRSIWGADGPKNATQRTLLWKDYISLTAGGKITAAAAEAGNDDLGEAAWLAHGNQVATWLAQNVAQMAIRVISTESHAPEAVAPVVQLYSRCLSLGYIDTIITTLLEELCIKHNGTATMLSSLLRSSKPYERRKSLACIISVLSKKYLQEEPGKSEQATISIGACITVLNNITNDDEVMKQNLCDWAVDPQYTAQVSSSTLRTVIATLALDSDALQDVLSNVWDQWGNQLMIKHAPSAQQNALSQILLLGAGYAHDAAPMYIFTMARSSVHTHGLSNRLASTSPRARWLGMVVGMAISKLTDNAGSRLKFETEDMGTAEAMWYQSLPGIRDRLGKVSGLPVSSVASPARPSQTTKPAKPRQMASRSKSKPAAPIVQSLPGPSIPSSLRIVELDDNDTEALIPHAKPDSDPEDDSPDPTLVTRNRPRPPVYIRDLLVSLNDAENFSRRTLALQTAASLVRRKTHHGKEVLDHLEELASTIAGLNDSDGFDVSEDEFIRLRERALRAGLLADAKRMGPWFSRAVSNASSDYSVAQRTALLVALGLGGRELAGYPVEDGEDDATAAQFVSKRMKGKMHDIWSSDPTSSATRNKRLKPTSMSELQLTHRPAITQEKYVPDPGAAAEVLTAALSREMLQPMALEAADKLTGPDVLKVRKFSSRMDIEARKQKPKANELSKIVAEAFFFPLTGGFDVGVQTRSSGGPTAFTHHLLPTYLRTLSILLVSAGPSTPSLQTLTSEFWDLLLALRSAASADLPTLGALLFGLLTLLELNEGKDEALVRDHAKALIETQEWSRMVLQGASDRRGGDEEEGKVRMMAAGVVVRCSEIVGKYQRRLLGDLVDV